MAGNAAFLGTTHKYLSETAKKRTFDDTLAILKDTVEVQPQGHAIDKEYPGDQTLHPQSTQLSIHKDLCGWRAVTRV